MLAIIIVILIAAAAVVAMLAWPPHVEIEYRWGKSDQNDHRR